MAEGGEGEDEIQFLRTDDEVVLQCVACIQKENRKFCLAAEGLGNRLCYLEPTSEAKYVPPDLCICTFVLEQSLSVRALQEMLAKSGQNSEGLECRKDDPVSCFAHGYRSQKHHPLWQVGLHVLNGEMGWQSLPRKYVPPASKVIVVGEERPVKAAHSGGHKTLLYGHAILLRHSFSSMYLACLKTSRSQTDKLSFDVGLQEDSTGEACWWTIHPASKQRSEGEKVRIGDDLILVSVSSERYLHLSISNGNTQVDASFMQTLWNVHPICSGSNIEEGYLLGGHVMRLFHGHDEVVTIPGSDQSEEQQSWSGSHIRWGQPFRMRHLTTGHYLALTEERGLVLQDRERSDTVATAFCFRASKARTQKQGHRHTQRYVPDFILLLKEKLEQSPKRDIEGMGVAEIKYGDSLCFIMHVATGLWLSYQAPDVKSARLGPLKRRACLHSEGHMDDGLTLQRCQHEESRAARIIRNTTLLFNLFIRDLDCLGVKNRALVTLPVEEVLQTLNDLITYFQLPDAELEHEERQIKLRSLKNRQNLFKQEGMLTLVSNCIDRLNVYNSAAHFGECAGLEAGAAWKDILNLLYELLAALIRGNRNNCTQFSKNLDWLVSKLERLESSSGILEVLHCILIESPEALNIIQRGHIKSIISLLYKHGRNHKILDVLCSLCVCNGVAVRANQNLICDHLLPKRDLLLQTQLVNDVQSMRPNIFLGVSEGSAQYKKWYYELVIDHVDHFVTSEPSHLRVGWANSKGYAPYPGGGEGWGGNGVGDDLYSFGFDGLHLWSGRVPRAVASVNQHILTSEDVVSCCLDLGAPSISFRINGQPVQGMFENFNTDGLFFPVVSFSAGVKVRYLLGGRHGDFKFLPPSSYAPCYEALLPKEKMKVELVKEYKRDLEGVRDLLGTTQFMSQASFIPTPVETSQIVMPLHLEKVRDKLAENIHELWGMNKIELGWSYGKDLKSKRNPRLVPYALLDERTKKSNRDSLREAIRTLIGYGYNIEPSDQEGAGQVVERLSIDKIRFFRVERTYAVKTGKCMPVEFHSLFKCSPVVDMNGVQEEDTLKVKHRYPLRSVRHSDESRRVDYSSITMNAMPLSSAIFKSEHKNPVPQCPPRLDVQTINAVLWSRMPNTFLKVETSRVSERHGWMVHCVEPLQMLAVHIPEENRCVDIMELSEQEDLRKFHYHTLKLYCALCALGNTRVAHALCSHMDQSQLLYTIDNQYLPGMLREGFYNVLISIHLETAKEARLMMKDEFIIPVTPETRSIRLFSDAFKKHLPPGVGLSTSLKPRLNFAPPCFISTKQEQHLYSPQIPLDALKEKAIVMLTEAVQGGGHHIRDPVGGGVEYHFVPILKLISTLLTMGVLGSEDVHKILLLIEPNVFRETHEDGATVSADKEGLTGTEEKAVEAGEEEAAKEAKQPIKGLLEKRLPEPVKRQMCELLHYFCDCELKHRIEAIVSFSDSFVSKLQYNQKFRYNELMLALNMSAAVTAKKTKEFRSPPQEQINMLLTFSMGEDCPCPTHIQEELYDFHNQLQLHCGIPMEEDEDKQDTSIKGRLLMLVKKIKGQPHKAEEPTEKEQTAPSNLKELISQTMVSWAQECHIQDPELVRKMFSLLRRQYDSIGELLRAMRKTYTISAASVQDTINLLASLGQIRSLLSVRMGQEEEKLMIDGLGDIMNNKVFYQHPNLMRILGMHETVMEVMVNVLGGDKSQEIAFPKMVASCCRFLCYFCRISRQNQKAMFDHLSYLLENSSVGLASPAMRGSTPLDVAASSVMDNNGLALALEEPDLDKVVTYLAGCGLQSCPMLLAKGYPDIGWNPIEGERYLSFLRFAVFVNGESVEENSSVVVKLLIRRPECFGPALRGEGGNGLLAAMKEAIKISETPALDLPGSVQGLSPDVSADVDHEEEVVHMGNAIMSFYSALIDLLGRCAPEMHLINKGKGEALRIRAILRSLVPTEDLVGIISIPLKMPITNKDGSVTEPNMSASFCPDHKAPMVLFLDRVYGIEDQSFLLHLLEVGFLSDLRAATSLDTEGLCTTETALALNRYIGSAMLPLLTRCAPLFAGTEHYATLIDSTLYTIYRLSKGRSLTKAQRDAIEECLLAVCKHLRPSMLQQLLCRLVFDVPLLTDYCKMPLRLLTNHYEQNWKYYCLLSGWGSYGTASEDELLLTKKIFWGVFDSLSQRKYDPELFKMAMPCLSAIAGALPPDYVDASISTTLEKPVSVDAQGNFDPKPINTANIALPEKLEHFANKYAEHSHEKWSAEKVLLGWKYGDCVDEKAKTHPQLRTYKALTEKEKEIYRWPIRESLKSMLAMGWSIDRTKDGESMSQQRENEKMRKISQTSQSNGFHPSPIDTSKVVLSRELQVLLPLIDQYFKNHSLYFLSSPNKNLSSSGYASNKEKEMVTSLFCKLAALVRHRISLFGSDSTTMVSCLHILAHTLDTRTVMKSGSEMVRVGLRTFFENAAEDLEKTFENLKLGKFTHSRSQMKGVSQNINYTTVALLPILTALFEHITQHHFGVDLLLDDVQVSCYRILTSLYALGTGKNIYVERQLPALGQCLATLAGALPVAFLEPLLNMYNPCSVFNTKSARERAILGIPESVAEMCPGIPRLDGLMKDINDMSESGARYTEMPHVIEVVLPMLCNYLSYWWERGPENQPASGGSVCCTTVTSEHLSLILGNILKILNNNLGVDEASWMKRIAVYVQPIISKARADLLKSHFLPTLGKLKKKTVKVVAEEELLKADSKGDTQEAELLILDEFAVLCRDLYAFYPMLIRYVDNNRSRWLKEPDADSNELFRMVAEIFILWCKSHNFKREEQNFVVQNEINNLSFLTGDSKTKMSKSGGQDQERKHKKRRGEFYSIQTSLIVAALKKMLPIGLNMCTPGDQELISLAKTRYLLKDTDEEVKDHIRQNLHLREKSEDPAVRWQLNLYKDIVMRSEGPQDPERVVDRIQRISAAVFNLEQVEQPLRSKKCVWQKLLSKQRKRAVVACFRMAPLYNLPRHRSINLFLLAYQRIWIETEEYSFEEKLVQDLAMPVFDKHDITTDVRATVSHQAEKTHPKVEEEEEEEVRKQPDPLHQLILHFSHNALIECSSLEEDPLYIAYADMMAKSCAEGEEEEEGKEKTFEEKQMEKQKMLYQQARLHDRGAAEMVLQMISASKGRLGAMVTFTLKLGISILNGGNTLVQQKMLDYLKEKRDAGFFKSLSGLMMSCSVLDLNAFERQNKAEGLGMVTEEGSSSKVLQNDEFTKDLFRFLQLLCEGHNNDFQNFLRTQTGNTTTVNIIISTVDYLLRLQESISDFYWYYSGKDVIDEAGQRNFSKALAVAKQVFNSLTEYIQGPCIGNQQSLAHSRLWDAVVGFLHVFANMQMKLSQDSSQIELLKELLDLQKDMIVMLLSLLEGNVVNGTIGKQMVDTLVESSSNVEMILKFFDMFLKLKDLTTSDSFKEYDPDSTGIISKKDFQKSMESQKQYSQSEIEFLLSCAEADENDMFNYEQFVERFHEPAKDIGFNVVVLLTNLAEHMPHDARLSTFLDLAESVLSYFEPYLGRIEIMGGAKRIERVYFEISESSRTQWEKPQVKESKRQFIFDVVNEGAESEKMELFVNFCEDTIFEMQLASQISEPDLVERTEEEEEDAQSMVENQEEEDEESMMLESSSAFTLACISIRKSLCHFRQMLTIKSMRRQYRKFRRMSVKEMVQGFFSFFWIIITGLFHFVYSLVWGFFHILWTTMFGGGLVEGAKNMKVTDILGNMPDPTQFGIHGDVLETEKMEANEASALTEMGQMAQGDGAEADLMAELLNIQPKKEGKHGAEPGLGDVSEVVVGDAPSIASAVKQKKAQMAAKKRAANGDYKSDSEKGDSEDGEKKDHDKARDEAPPEPSVKEKKAPKKRLGQKKDPPEAFTASFFAGLEIYQTKMLNYLARNFYNLRFLALFVAFAINFILLFYKVTGDYSDDEDPWNGQGRAGEEEDEGALEYFVLQESTGYMAPTLRCLAILHTIISFLCVVGYYYLKVPLVVFKREKEIARKLEFAGLYITEQPSDDDIRGQWDRLVINTPSFPNNYWDKFVKRKVIKKYGDLYGAERIAELLGLDKSALDFNPTEETLAKEASLVSWLSSIDTKYHVWKMGVVFTDNSFLYLVWYTTMSILGHYNNFFFAAHLLDIAMGFKTLRTILSSVTHNGKQLVLTVGLLAVVVYLYTVVAFNFFRKFYNKSADDDEPDMKCDDMMTCYLFHMYVGVRAGGGIGDEIEDPAGDPYELYRILFDITFFFFVIVILLAIIQGLIIDAFGELRDQQEQVKEDMETKCFICGIGNDYFDTTPHGFETHTLQEHNLANYLFFLMYLINKDETEHTGQESYVWKMYQERCWDFFPAGDCFRKQNEDQLG
ncbi:Ryanodine receptor 3 [Channa argus]|uniref:Ryanodine receptor 3 n=1 Tax=Channa argus TaxID=215402 RepID=A0A6G1QFJ1_CHAAH|nr:Ryanodine receptor 3 [Channa argus]